MSLISCPGGFVGFALVFLSAPHQRPTPVSLWQQCVIPRASGFISPCFGTLRSFTCFRSHSSNLTREFSSSACWWFIDENSQKPVKTLFKCYIFLLLVILLETFIFSLYYPVSNFYKEAPIIDYSHKLDFLVVDVEHIHLTHWQIPHIHTHISPHQRHTTTQTTNPNDDKDLCEEKTIKILLWFENNQKSFMIFYILTNF